LRAKYSYRVLNSTTFGNINNALGVQYVNGIGLVYQRDFDTFGEFIRNMFRRNTRRSGSQNPATPKPTTPAVNNKPMEKEEDQ
jgi:hypothetical protein